MSRRGSGETKRTHITVKSAAKQMGVSHELLNGLAESRQIPAEKVIGKTGKPLFIIATDDVARIAKMIGEGKGCML